MTALTLSSHVNMEVVPEAEPVAATEGTATVVEADEARVALVDVALEGLADLGDRGDRGDLVGLVMMALPSVTTMMILDPTANQTTIQSSKRGQLPFTNRTLRRPSGRASPK